MFKRNKSSAPRRDRDGLTSFVLLQEGDVPGGRLAVTWVDVEPGKAQRPHRHDPEQVYVVTGGRGRMHVASEAVEIREGDLVYVPSGAEHYAENTGDGVLTYVSAATPAFDLTGLYDRGGT